MRSVRIKKKVELRLAGLSVQKRDTKRDGKKGHGHSVLMSTLLGSVKSKEKKYTAYTHMRRELRERER
jgi:hypothetical protein